MTLSPIAKKTVIFEPQKIRMLGLCFSFELGQSKIRNLKILKNDMFILLRRMIQLK